MKPEAQSKSFGPDGDIALAMLYKSVGAQDTQQKLNILQIKLGGTPNFYAMGGGITDEMKLACLEYEYLERSGIIQFDLV